MLFAIVWTGLEGIVPSEMSQTEKDKYCMISAMPVCSVDSVMFNSL